MTKVESLLAEVTRALEEQPSDQTKGALEKVLEYMREQDRLERERTIPRLNPVTFRGLNGREKMALTFGRLWTAKEGEEWDKKITVVVYEEPVFGEFQEEHIRAVLVIPEEHVINGLKAVFPNGELNQRTAN